MTQPPEWYRDGLAFECTMCGRCCTGPPGAVWFTEEEGSAMAAELEMEEAAFFRNFARRIGGRWSLSERQTPHGLDCVFLDRETIPGKAICRVYGSRPAQCRTWPFWPENLTTRKAWDEAGQNCPGMGQGQVIPVEEVRIRRDATPPD
jgi:uncharacterized protein